MWSSSGVFFSFIFNNVLAVSLRTLKNTHCTSYFESLKKLYIFIQDQNYEVKQPLTQMLSLKHRNSRLVAALNFSDWKPLGCLLINALMTLGLQSTDNPKCMVCARNSLNDNCLTWDLKCPWATNPAIFEMGVREFSFLLARNILALNQKSQSS